MNVGIFPYFSLLSQIVMLVIKFDPVSENLRVMLVLLTRWSSELP